MSDFSNDSDSSKTEMRFLFFILILFSTALNAKNPKTMHGVFPAQDYRQFWFLYESEKRPGQNQWFFRPFYSHYKEEQSAHQFNTSLYPLYYREKTNHWSKWTFMFLFGQDTTVHPDTGEDDDLALSPLFQWGRGETDRDRYFAVFPFFGNINSKLGWQKIHYAMFPIYTSWEHKDFKAHSFLWPLTMYGTSDVRQEYRLFPFFTKKTHIGKFEHYNVFWPFVSWGRDSLDKREPTSYIFLWLLYAHKNSYYGNMKSFGIMPVLGSMALFSWGHDRRSSETNVNLLFFLIQYGSSEDKDYRKHIFFPFYGYSRFASKEFRFITPLFIKLNTDSYLVESESWYFLPVFHYNREYFRKEERTDTYYKVWPFWKWHKDTEGNLSTNLLSLFPFRSESMERLWEPVWSVFEYKSQINGEKRVSLLMRLYSQRWSEEEFHFYVPLVMDYSNTKDSFSMKFLYGLLGYEKKDSSSTYQFLWFLKI
ncbi:MAG TPA: hypothetical protein PK683_00755 [Leptospiraceae bacterium]|nr:hypothetical protein [Leptospiraceae bacterium]